MKLPMQEPLFLKSRIFIMTLYLFKFSLAGDFSYTNADAWDKTYLACSGARQSPIDLSLSNLDDSKRDNKITIQNYDALPKRIKLVNNGHTVKLEYEWGDRVPIISGETFNGQYRLHSVSFRWNTRNNSGSEHTFQGERAAMEIQFFHYNIEYESVIEALNYVNAFVTIGKFLFTEPLKNNSFESPVLHQVLSKFPQVPRPGSAIDIEPFSVSSFMPLGAKDTEFIVYHGSFAIPPCTENMIWVLDIFTYLINEKQLKDIQNLVQLEKHIDHNFRKIQPLNGRRLYLMSMEALPPS